MNRAYIRMSHRHMLLDMALDLFEAARNDFERRRRARPRRDVPTRGRVPAPGPDTPLWNELVRQVLPLLRKRGSKVHLARMLNFSRQRLNVCLKAQRACFDAERTLLLLVWLGAQKGNREIFA